MNVDKKRRTPDARDVFDDYGINAVLSQSLKPIGHRTEKKFNPMMHAMSVQNAAMVCEDPEISVDAHQTGMKVGLDAYHITRYRNPSRNRRQHQSLRSFRPLSHPRQKSRSSLLVSGASLLVLGVPPLFIPGVPLLVPGT